MTGIVVRDWLTGALLALCLALLGAAPAAATDACGTAPAACAEVAQDCGCTEADEGGDDRGSGACDGGPCLQCHCAAGAGVALPASPQIAPRSTAPDAVAPLPGGSPPPSFRLPGPDRPPRA